MEVALPLGISFFTFHKISYVVDVYRGVSAPASSFVLCLLYICLFPHLIAGPIVRYRDVDRQLVARAHTVDRFLSGICRFCLGLAKKVLVANVLAETADAVFDAPRGSLYPAVAWIGVLAYSFQIYFDFSGYSDMAIGLGRMFGIEFLENFDRPYLSRSFTEFWQRWHISLSRFMRDYLFLPLGGNRLGPIRGYANLWIVFLLSGLWHGAAWTFVVWGAYQGLFLSLDRLFWGKVVARLPRARQRPDQLPPPQHRVGVLPVRGSRGRARVPGPALRCGRADGGRRTLAHGARSEPPRPRHDGRGGADLLPARAAASGTGARDRKRAGTSCAWSRRPRWAWCSSCFPSARSRTPATTPSSTSASDHARDTAVPDRMLPAADRPPGAADEIPFRPGGVAERGQV